MRTRRHYIPLLEAKVGMLLSAPACVVERGVLSVRLSAGQALTEDGLHQLHARHAEFIFVEEADTRSDEQVGIDAALAARRVQQIFEGADLTDPNMAALFDQILAYRSE